MKHLGYVIVNDIEEYLFSFENQDGYFLSLWSNIPESSLVVPTIRKARRLLSKIETSHSLWVASLFETSNNFVVSFIGDDLPPWIENVN